MRNQDIIKQVDSILEWQTHMLEESIISSCYSHLFLNKSKSYT